jgi:cysteinyl-tRNA synthetase
LLVEFMAALEDDLNFPRALAELFRLAKAARVAETAAERAGYKAALRDAGGVLGLLQQDPAVWFGSSMVEASDAAEIERLLDERLLARAEQDYVTADRIREQLAALGVTIQDGSDGQSWRRT